MKTKLIFEKEGKMRKSPGRQSKKRERETENARKVKKYRDQSRKAEYLVVGVPERENRRESF